MALIELAKIAIESAAWGAAHGYAADLRAVAQKLSGEGSEGTIADALDALAFRGSGHAEGPGRVAIAIEALSAADARAMLAYVLTVAAEMELECGALDVASRLAARALAAAEPLGKPSALVLAHVVISRSAEARGDASVAGEHLSKARALLAHPYGVSKRARGAAMELVAHSNARANAGEHGQGAG